MVVSKKTATPSLVLNSGSKEGGEGGVFLTATWTSLSTERQGAQAQEGGWNKQTAERKSEALTFQRHCLVAKHNFVCLSHVCSPDISVQRQEDWNIASGRAQMPNVAHERPARRDEERLQGVKCVDEGAHFPKYIWYRYRNWLFIVDFCPASKK